MEDSPNPRHRILSIWRTLASITLLTFLLLLTGNLGAKVLVESRYRPDRVNPDFVGGFELAYPDFTADERYRLQRESSHPFTQSIVAQPREEPFSGEFVTIDPAGFRHGIDQASWPPRKNAFVVFVFGGSTAFGYGVRDQDTVSSYLQKELARMLPTEDVAVYNFARGGFYSTQERLQFDILLTLGEKPDLAVFIDGLNEFSLPDEPPIFTAFETANATESLRSPLRAAVRALPLFLLLNPGSRGERFADHVARSAGNRAGEAPRAPAELLARYIANTNIIRALGKAYSVTTRFVWQPIPVFEYDLQHHPAWKGHIGKRHTRGFELMQSQQESSPTPGLVSCAEIQRSIAAPLYIDHVHYNPQMSRLLAECIANGLRRSGALIEAAQKVPSPFG